jgi:hypothetical protein
MEVVFQTGADFAGSGVQLDAAPEALSHGLWEDEGAGWCENSPRIVKTRDEKRQLVSYRYVSWYSPK